MLHEFSKRGLRLLRCSDNPCRRMTLRSTLASRSRRSIFSGTVTFCTYSCHQLQTATWVLWEIPGQTPTTLYFAQSSLCVPFQFGRSWLRLHRTLRSPLVPPGPRCLNVERCCQIRLQLSRLVPSVAAQQPWRRPSLALGGCLAWLLSELSAVPQQVWQRFCPAPCPAPSTGAETLPCLGRSALRLATRP